MGRFLSADEYAVWAEYDEFNGSDLREADEWFEALVDRLGDPADDGWGLGAETPNHFTLSYALNWRMIFGDPFAECEPWLEHFQLIDRASDALRWREAGWGPDAGEERSPEVAGVYDDAGVSPLDAEPWVANGFLAGQAVKFIAAGIDCEEALSGDWCAETIDTMIALRKWNL